jgi:hypothetical protein
LAIAFFLLLVRYCIYPFHFSTDNSHKKKKKKKKKKEKNLNRRVSLLASAIKHQAHPPLARKKDEKIETEREKEKRLKLND